jgi:hypothetical protein
MSTALATQDPFVLTPAERSRYETLFPQYAKDGFVYGPQAVELFSKSGVPQSQLAAIWSMVDTNPVDNRLDALEFAMAMHLIVCVSKKNLPLPPALPHSLKVLKDQQHQQPPSVVVPQHQQHLHQPALSQPGSPVSAARTAPTPPPLPMTQQAQYGYQQPTPPPAMGGRIPSPMPASQQYVYQQPPPPAASISSPQPIQHTMAAPPQPEPAATSAFSSLPSPPPLAQTGGMSISDAFEGLDGGATLGMSGGVPPATSFGGYGGGFGGDASVSSAQDELRHHHHEAATVAPEPAPALRSAAPAFAEPPKTAQQIKESYNLGESTEELSKLKAVLQKLQAENISLKATMGSLTEEEKDVQRELHGVVAEISKLSNELTSLRAKVLASKSRLLEATAELKANNEKKGYDVKKRTLFSIFCCPCAGSHDPNFV